MVKRAGLKILSLSEFGGSNPLSCITTNIFILSMNFFLMVEYGVRCENIHEGPHPSIRICEVRGYLGREGGEVKVGAYVDKHSIRKIGDDFYFQVGVIPTRVIPHQKPSRMDRFLIEFGQETRNGLWRIWVDESSLVELPGSRA